MFRIEYGSPVARVLPLAVLPLIGLAGCADDATGEPRADADASDAAVSDAGPGTGGHLCPWESAEMSDGQCVPGPLDFPASSCPEERPTVGSSCASPQVVECYYCEPGQSEWRVDEEVPTFRCEADAWIVSDQLWACHPERPPEVDADAG